MKKNWLVKKLCVVFTLLYFLACVSSQQNSGPITRRAGPDSLNLVPRFTLLKDTHWRPRVLASKDLGKLSFMEFSNKQVYFSTLFWQFQKLKAFRLGPFQNIRYCPSFHSAFLELKKKSPSPVKLNGDGVVLQKLIDLKPKKEIMAIFPEMALPLTHTLGASTLYEVLSKYSHDAPYDLLVQGINIHTKKIYQELQQLCHTGYSQNYFIFENLISYVHQNPHFKNGAAPLLSLLESTVFFNFIFLNFLGFQHRGEFPFSSSKLEEEMVSRLRADWSYNYFYQLRRRRLDLLKNIETVSSTRYGQILLRR